MTEIVLVAAVADNDVIGAGNTIPWRLKSDMQRLKAITMNKPVLMGRKTFASLKRPLPGRTNIVITRDPAFDSPGIVVATSFEAALGLAQRSMRISLRLPTASKSPKCTPRPKATHASLRSTGMRGRRSRGSGTKLDRTTMRPSPM
jgi:hypothetical protein